MHSTVTSPTTPTTSMTRIGLVVLGLLSVSDIALPFIADGNTPPMGVALAACALGVASLVALLPAARGSRRALLTLVGLRLLSALLAVPAFFVSAVPTPVVALGAVLVAVTIAAIIVVLRPARTAAVAS